MNGWEKHEIGGGGKDPKMEIALTRNLEDEYYQNLHITDSF